MLLPSKVKIRTMKDGRTSISGSCRAVLQDSQRREDSRQIPNALDSPFETWKLRDGSENRECVLAAAVLSHDDSVRPACVRQWLQLPCLGSWMDECLFNFSCVDSASPLPVCLPESRKVTYIQRHIPPSHTCIRVQRKSRTILSRGFLYPGKPQIKPEASY